MNLWSPRFKESMTETVYTFNASLPVDARLYREDIKGSLAHCRELEAINLLTKEESHKIQTGLNKICAGLESEHLTLNPEHEDIHMAVEKMLIAEIGDLGKKLHTGRSRNDQVALDMHMYQKKSVRNTQKQLKALLKNLHKTAQANVETLMPGFTHLMAAQPITLGFHILTYTHMFIRDYKRLEQAYNAANHMPLGSGALSGANYPINRNRVAKDLGFEHLAVHAMDAVSDRDYIQDYLYSMAMIMQHLSRLSEELILWSSAGYGYIRIGDAFCTGSSIMPQKRNPDILELIRGKTGRVYGNLMQMLTLMKGLPLAYNKDMQEDKESLFDTVDTVNACLRMMTGLIESIEVSTEAMKRSMDLGFLNATELADYLVVKGMAFRDAHSLTASIVCTAEEQGLSLAQITLAQYQSYSPIIQKDVYHALDYKRAVNNKKTIGSTAFASVQNMCDALAETINHMKE